MSLKDLTAYWSHWVSKDKKGDLFFFLGDSSNRGKSGGVSDKGDSDNDSDDEDGTDKSSVISPDHFSIDHKIPHSSSCDDPSSCSNCLQISETFYQLVEMVDELEVSPISDMISTISHNFRTLISQTSIKIPHGRTFIGPGKTSIFQLIPMKIGKHLNLSFVG